MNKDKNSVLIGGNPCEILSCSLEQIICTTPAELPNVTKAVLPYAVAAVVPHLPRTWEQKLVEDSGPESATTTTATLTPTLYGSGWTTDTSGSTDTYYTTTNKGVNYAKYTNSPNALTSSGLYNVTINIPESCPSSSHTSTLSIVVQAGANTIVETISLPSDPHTNPILLAKVYHNKTSFISVTIDTTDTTNCVAISTVGIAKIPDPHPTAGCMDFKAANYQPNALADDNSCIYAKGRGLSTQVRLDEERRNACRRVSHCLH